MSRKAPIKWDFRDVSSGIRRLRDFLLGRKHTLHNRFPPLLSPRSIPPPDIPRGPDYKYADQYYCKRNVLDSVKPPVVAPIAEGVRPCKPNAPKAKTKYRAKAVEGPCIQFPCPPTPGPAWWWDGHCYYKQTEICTTTPQPPHPTETPPPDPAACYASSEPPKVKKPKKRRRKPCPPVKDDDPCKEPEPCKLEPCRVIKEPPPKPPPRICDPCKPPDGSSSDGGCKKKC